jgi:putative ABC transport system permease protein
MKYLHLIWASLMRSRTRTVLTLMSVAAAFFLFGMLDSVRIVFNSSANVSGADRLIVASKLSITQSLPYSVLSRIQEVPSVQKVSYASWFGGMFRDDRNFFPNFAVGPGYMDVYPEYEISREQMQLFEATRTGAIVGESLAKRHGWKIGDTIPLRATIFPQNGSNDWPLKLTGIFKIRDSKRTGEENQLMFHWKYFDEANDYTKNQVGWVVVKLDSAKSAVAASRAIDKIFENSDHETRTQTEQAFNQAFAKQFADVGLIVTAIMGAVFFTLMLLTGSTITQTVRERIPELAVLKTIGFSPRSVMGLVLAESCLIVLAGCALGVGLASLVMPAISANSNGIIALQGVLPQTWLAGAALSLLIGIVVGLSPALRALRLNIVDALAGR